MERQTSSYITSSSFFKLFFTPAIFRDLAQFTNDYAVLEGAESNSGRQRWRQTSAGELMVFIGLMIYMGAHKAMQVPLYWSKNAEFPTHEISRYMSQYRFEQLKRYFHVSPINQNIPRPTRQQWAQKVQPLASQLEKAFQQDLIPASHVSVDEIMVRFTGRSSHTVMIHSKPILQGYKILALCERGYTYSFIFTSRLDKFSNLNRTLYNGPSRLNLLPTSHAVFQLVSALPYHTYRFILYSDNYFSNIPLFKALREYSIAACGTTRPTSASYPQLFKIDKRTRCLPWNTLSAIKHSDVLVVLWQDKNLVRFLLHIIPARQNPKASLAAYVVDPR